MNRTCPEFDRLESRFNQMNGGEVATWQAHLKHCDVCRLQWGIHEKLQRSLRFQAQPHLSPEFDDRLRTKLKGQFRPGSLEPPIRRWMQSYWVAASVISAVILLRVDWPNWLKDSWGYIFAFLILGTSLLQLFPARKIRKTALFLSALLEQ